MWWEILLLQEAIRRDMSVTTGSIAAYRSHPLRVERTAVKRLAEFLYPELINTRDYKDTICPSVSNLVKQI